MQSVMAKEVKVWLASEIEEMSLRATDEKPEYRNKTWNATEDKTLENVLLELSRLNQRFDLETNEMNRKMNDLKMEVVHDLKNVKSEINAEVAKRMKAISELKSSGEMNERAISTLFTKMNASNAETKAEMKELNTTMAKQMETSLTKTIEKERNEISLFQEKMELLEEKLRKSEDEVRDLKESNAILMEDLRKAKAELIEERLK